jgi:hypothetical protein
MTSVENRPLHSNGSSQYVVHGTKDSVMRHCLLCGLSQALRDKQFFLLNPNHTKLFNLSVSNFILTSQNTCTKLIQEFKYACFMFGMSAKA